MQCTCGSSRRRETSLVVRPSAIILSRESVELLSASTTDSGWSYLEWCRHEYVRSHPSRDPIIAMSWGVSSGALYNAEHLLSWCLSAQPWSKLYGLKKTYPTFPAAWEVTHRPTWLIDLHWRDARCEGRRAQGSSKCVARKCIRGFRIKDKGRDKERSCCKCWKVRMQC